MKKYIVMLLCLLFLPVVVSAKGEPPVYINYKIRVINENGITLKTNSNKEINIPYNTTLEVMYEYELDGKLYANVEYNNNSGMIEVKDIELLSKEVDFEKYKSEEEKQIYVFGNGTYLYNGPSKAYGLVEGNIEVEPSTILSYTYGDDAWVYVTYKGTKGWIYIYTYNDIIYEKGALVASVYDNKKIYTLNDIELTSSLINNDDIKLTIPKYQEISCKYVYSKDPYTTYYYVTYNDISGWYKYTPLQVADMYEEDFIVNATENVDIYEKPLLNSNIIGKINKNEEYNIIAIALKDSIEDNSYESWSYIKYNDKLGWIHYFEKGAEKSNTVNTPDETKKEDKNNKPSDSTKIILFSISIIIIMVFILFTLLKFNKSKNKEI